VNGEVYCKDFLYEEMDHLVLRDLAGRDPCYESFLNFCPYIHHWSQNDNYLNVSLYGLEMILYDLHGLYDLAGFGDQLNFYNQVEVLDDQVLCDLEVRDDWKVLGDLKDL